MRLHLVANDVITNQEKKEIDKMTGEDQMAEILDILQTSLNNKQTKKFKGFLQAMEQSEDELLKETAKKLGEWIIRDLHMYIATSQLHKQYL